MKISSADIAFPDYGVVMVLGHNAASGGALESIGSGKTSFGEAICRTLFGSSRFTHAKQCSTDKKGDTYVHLECELNGEPLLVESGYRCAEMSKSGEALRYTWKDQVIERGHINETREQLTQVLGIDAILVPWTVFIDGDNLKFNKIGQAESVQMVLAALRQPPWNAYHESARKILGDFKREMAKHEAQIESHGLRLERARNEREEAKVELEDARTALEVKRQSQNELIADKEEVLRDVESAIDKIRDRRKKIISEIKEIENSKAEEHHKLEIELRDSEEHLRKFRERRKTYVTSLTEAQTAATEARTSYSNYRDSVDVCPTCRRPMGEDKIDQKRLQKLKTKYEEAQALVKQRSELLEAADTDTENFESELEKLREDINKLSVESQVRGLSDEDRRLEDSLQLKTEQVGQIKLQIERLRTAISDEPVKRAEERLNERKRVVKETKQLLEESQAALEESKAEVKILEYWVAAYSPYGIPNLVLKEAIAPLNQEARRISALMTGGTIEVAYSTRRELASGMSKAELVVNVNNTLGSDELAGSSKGEARLTNLVIAETLSEVGQVSRLSGYRWYDEILTNLDKTSRTNILKYLKEVATRMKILIFVVDHHTETANYADYVLKVEKLSDSAKVSWA